MAAQQQAQPAKSGDYFYPATPAPQSSGSDDYFYPANGGASKGSLAPVSGAGLPVGTHPAGLPAGMNLPGLPGSPSPLVNAGVAPPSAQYVSTALSVARPVRDAVKGVGEGGLNTLLNVNNLVQNHTGAFGQWAGLTPEQQQELRSASTPDNTAQAIGKGAEQVGEFFLPGSAEEAGAAKLAPYVGKYLPAAKMALAGLGAGAVNKAQGGSFGTGAAGGAVGSGIGRGASAIAPHLAESALNVTGLDRLFGRRVGEAILEDTSGYRPGVVAQSARDTVNSLRPQLQQAASDAGANGARGSLAPARAAVAGRIGDLTQQRAVNSAAELTPLQNFLATDQVTGLPLSATQTPEGLLNLKRGVDADFIGNWNPTRNSPASLDAAKQAYGQLANEFHASAPGTQEIDQRMSSLIPVIDRGNRAALNAGIPQQVVHVLRAPTGAAVGALGVGGEEYERTHSVPRAIVGALAGAALPRLIASPEALMVQARAANSLVPASIPALTGSALQWMRPSTQEKQ